MIKIESIDLAYRGRTIKFCDDIEVEFDALGCAEVEKEQALRLLTVYKGMLCEAGKGPKKETVKEVFDDKELKSEIEKLKGTLLTKDEKIKDVQDKLEEEKASSTNWKNLYDESEKDANKNELTEKVKTLEMENDMLKVKCQLFTKSKAELREVAAGLEINEDEYKDLKTDELVEFLITKL